MNATETNAGAEIVSPIVHLNGTAKQSLIDQLCEVYSRLGDVCGAMREAAPNGRDYYPDPGRLEKAIEQHRRRMKAVDSLRDEIKAEIGLIDEQ